MVERQGRNVGGISRGDHIQSSRDADPAAAVHAYFLREVRPHLAEAWIDLDKTKIGYEISFNKYFYRHQPLRRLDEVTREILDLEAETDGLLKRLVNLAEVS